MNVTLRRAELKDAVLLYDMQKRAFAALYAKYHDTATSPHTERYEKTGIRITREGHFYYVILVDGEPAGGICVRYKGDVKNISPLYVLPEHQGWGVAQKAVRLAEEIHGGSGWELETIAQEEKLRHLYEKLGYKATQRITPVQAGMDLIEYVK